MLDGVGGWRGQVVPAVRYLHADIIGHDVPVHTGHVQTRQERIVVDSEAGDGFHIDGYGFCVGKSLLSFRIGY